MTDTLSIAERSRLMAKIKGKNTAPERAVRSLLHRAGYRFRIHVRGLPGTPDVVLPKYRAVVFVHGCFWHRHGCARSTTPATNVEFWRAKLDRNQARDRAATKELRRRGYKVEILWECELERGVARLLRRLVRRRAALAAGAR